MKKWLTALIAAAVLTASAASGLLGRLDNMISDRLYQHSGISSRDIVVVGLDQQSLEELGPMPWPRSYMAEAITFLNNAEPDARPAVIGIDVLYIGNSADEITDRQLVSAAAQYRNVVFASAADFGSDAVADENGIYSVRERAVLGFDRPFDELAEASSYGHINAMADSDGIIRHALLYVDVPENGRVYSFSRVIYEKWCEQQGITPTELPAASKSGFFYIPFSTGGGDYCDGVSFVDLLNGDVEPDFYKDKIVLVGPYASGMQDAYPTSLDRSAYMYGIDINANLVEAFQKGFYPREAGNLPQLIILFLLSFLSAAYFQRRELRYTVLLWLVLCAGWIGLCLLLYRNSLILHVIWVPLSVSILFLVSIISNYLHAQAEKRKIAYTFGRYIDPAIMKRLLDQGVDALELGGKTYDIAVLFVDIRGFTAMSEALDAQTVVEIINKYLTLTTECIIRNHGVLDKFIGDCTMAFWNAPFPQEDPVYLACCAAQDMIRESDVLSEELMQKYGRTVSFGIGIHYGPAVVGNIGAPQRLDYTAIGDTVNTASRLEANAKGGKIYISRAVADQLGDRARVTSFGSEIRLKGKLEGFEVLSLDYLERVRE